MNTMFRKIIWLLLVACYSLSVTIGTVVVLRELLNSGDKHYRLTAEKKSYPVAGVPVWTVKTHTLPASHSELSLHDGAGGDIFVFDKLPGIYVVEYFQSKYTYLASLPSKPRDPPII